MNLKISKKVQTILKIIFVSIVFIFVIREFSHILKGVNPQYFIMYRDKLTVVNLIVIGILGIISYAPLSFYDFILKKKVGINLPYKKLYKYSWIASSVASLMGFGGAASLAIKQHFYGDYVEDKKLLLKEISKIIGLNLSGLAGICLFYLATDYKDFLGQGWVIIPMVLLAAYVPCLLGYLVYKLIKTKDLKDFLGTLAIIGMSILEWVTTVILIYVILRITGAHIGFYKFLPVYITSAVIGIISMIPGGAGTFDLAFITGVESFGIPVAQALIVVLLYRISYYIVPVIIGIALYGHDFSKKMNERYNNLPDQIISSFAYKFLRLMVFLTGITMLLTGINERLLLKIRLFGKFFGTNTLGFSNDLSILIGFLCIVAACMLRYKTKYIYKATLVLIIVGILTLLSKGFYPGEIIISVVAAYILYRSKSSFYRESFIVNWKNTIKDASILIASLLGYYAVLDFYLKYTKGHLEKELFRQLGGTALSMFIIAAIIYIVIYFMHLEQKFPTKTFYDYEDDIHEIVKNYRGSSLTHLVYLRDKYIYMNEDKDVMFQYQTYLDKIFVLGNPIGNNEKIFAGIESFYELADKYGYTIVFYQIEEDMIKYLHSHGYDFMKIGEEAMIDVQSFEVVGNKMKSLKKSRNKMVSDGYTFEMIYPPYSQELMARLKYISDDWLDGRSEKGYSVGFFDEYYLSKEGIGLVKNSEGEIEGFANIMSMYNGKESFSVDLMRFTKEATRGVMDYMFINLIEVGKEKGYEKFNMGMAPLANVGTSKYAFLSEKIALQVYEYGQIFYSFKGLRKFKNKYTNNWEPRYVAYRRKTPIVFSMIQAALLAKNAHGKNISLITRIKNAYFDK
ncbi:bifunctional lysylphosphatidylglycerol flippase/synthetase MprF [uncultured Clostridium sp.]|jgi:phosphatidylglycerol lysyltransferase|uniref:bifunctional lysylphosphatidylglycerol flippase/synthetase MprF n=1 Tax=uncultured Clostridium sp. TaxID=59620 RepID=UPI00261F9C45|nr:bifunctional lysylphosphatidylglycerol flippase/synthetase MprF [uncultured Clostridium sp.]